MAAKFWELGGNSIANPDIDFLGTTDNEPLVIKTVGVERMRIDTGGNTGIGTSTPSARLHLDQAPTSGGVDALKITSGGGPDVASLLLQNTAAGGLRLRHGVGTGMAYLASSGTLALIANDTGTPSFPSGPQMTIAPNGNIGIGMTTPAFALHMPAGKALRIEGGTNPADAANYFSFGGNGSFGIDAPGVPNGRFVVLNSGNVGVGTPDPVAKLDVANGLLHVGGTVNPAVNSQGAYLGWNATGGTGETDFINNQGGGSGGFAFINAPPSGNPLATLLTIAGDGTVGIGTAPSQATRLTVLFPEADILGLPTAAGVIGQVTNIQQIGFGRQTAGVRGINDEGHGVQGQSDSHVGCEGTSNSGTAMFAQSGTGVGVWATTTSGPFAGLFQGPVLVTGALSKPGGGFRIDHPTDPANKYLNHSFVESSEMKNIYDGVARMDSKGEAIVALPTWMDKLNEEFRVQLTPVGAPAPQIHVAEEVRNGKFRIAGGSSGQQVFWQVTGVRKDPWAKAHPLAIEEDKKQGERDFYLHPELYGKRHDRNLLAAQFPNMAAKI